MARTAGSVLGLVALLVASACVVVPSPVVELPPPVPAPRVEALPIAPGPGYIWVPGHWAWRHPGCAWPGRYAIPPAPAYMWIPPYWAPPIEAHIWVGGHWGIR